MSFCRVVLIPEECYDELISERTGEEKTTTPVQEPAEPVEKENKTVEPPPQRESSPAKPPTPPPTPEEKTPTVHPTVIQYLPPAYHQVGQRLLSDLQNKGLDISNKEFVVQGQALGDFTIGDFLRAAILVDHPGPIPLALQEWLRQKRILEFPNAERIMKPAWEVKHSLRRSTRVPRPVRSGAQRPSMRGLKR